MEYTLCGVCISTSPDRGHYVSFVKTSNGWFETDDTQVFQDYRSYKK